MADGDVPIDLTSDADEAQQPQQQHGGGNEPAGVLEQQLASVTEELAELADTLQALRERQLELQQRKQALEARISAERRAPRADWASASFPWDGQLQAQLQSAFGLATFRPLQREVMNATLQGRDVLLLLPSGGGKSLCYQLPALLSGGVTLVVSPLLSLIKDQVMGLQGRIRAVSLTSADTKDQTAAAMAALTDAAAGSSGGSSSDAMLLYVTPEKIVASKRLMAKLEKIYAKGQLKRIAIDEAHCCSTWGNDFRPDYKKLGVLRQQFRDTPIMALTATATPQVATDICSILHIQPERFTASVNRPSLCYEVLHKAASAEAASAQVVAWVQQQARGTSGIVYCLTRKDCEATAAALARAGVPAVPYHADMHPAERSAAHEAWSSGAVQVIAATIAFGMGINKGDVRFVLHEAMSKSIENYYQESGRAGRDGQPARCVLFYRFADALKQAAIVCMDHGWQQRLTAAVSYASAARGCRRAMLAAHFGEPPPPCSGTCMCDLCKASAAAAGQQQQQQQHEVDIAAPALHALAALKERKTDRRATLNQLLDAIQKAGKQASNGEGGSGKRGKAAADGGGGGGWRDELEWVLEQMQLRGLLDVEFGFTPYSTNTYLTASAAGEAFVAAAGQQRLTAARPLWQRTHLQQQGDQQQGQLGRQPVQAQGGGAKRSSSCMGSGHSDEDDDVFVAGVRKKGG